MDRVMDEDANVNLHCGASEKRGEPPGQGQASAGLTGVLSPPLRAMVGQLSLLQGRAVS